jgi:hypothetical protein
MASKHHCTREKQIKLLPQTHSPEVYYSLFIVVAVLVMSERLEKRPVAALAAFPSLIFVGSASILWFHVSPPPPHENTSVSLYIEGFR